MATDKMQVIFRRLLLAKQLYLHGLDHSNKADALNKMIAVHNFHNAIEIALRAIISHYDIRVAKPLHIEFEAMLNEIDNFQEFKDRGIRLPYRQDVRSLNQLRNHVQHDAIEPESTTMERWRVFTREFLERTCETYFGLVFDGLSPLDMINDLLLKKILTRALSSKEKNHIEESLAFSKIAFELASIAFLAYLPIYETTDQIGRSLDLVNFKEIDEGVNHAFKFTAVLSAGVSLIDYHRFVTCTPHVDFALTGNPHIYWRSREESVETAQWAHEFVVATIVRWQTLGLSPCVPEWLNKTAQELIESETPLR